MELCKIYPLARNGKDSQLFKDALDVSSGNREFASYVWGLSLVPSYMQGKDIDYDWNGEPTLESFLKSINMSDGLDMSKLHLIKDEMQVGAVDKNGNQITYDNVEEIIDKAVKYNSEHENVFVLIENTVDGVVLKVTPNTVFTQLQKNDLKFNNELNTQLERILNNAGFAISREDNLSEYGIFDPRNASETAYGLMTVIRISKGQEGERSIPEEFSHLTIAGLRYLDLTKRILSNLRDQDVLKVVYGDEYLKYHDRYNGNIDKLAEEAAGKLLLSFLTDRLNNYSNIDSLLERLWNNAKKKYSSIDEESVMFAIRESARGLQEISEIAFSDDFGKLINKKEIFDTEPLFRLSKETDLIKEIFEEMMYKYEIMFNQIKEQPWLNIPESDINLFKKMKDDRKSEIYLPGINDFMSMVIKRLGNLMFNANSQLLADTSDPELVSQYLNDLNDLIKGVKPSVKKVIGLKYKQERGEFNIDPKNIPFTNIQNTARSLMEELERAEEFYKEMRQRLLYDQILRYWGGSDKKIISIGLRKGETLSLEHVMEVADSDVSWANMMIVSLADSTDELSKVLYSIIRDQLNQRDSEINEYISTIRALHRMLIDSGSGTDFMLERNDKGEKTGRIISDIDFPKFNKARKEFLASLKERGLTWEQRRAEYEKWMKLNCVCIPIIESGLREKTRFSRQEFIDPINRDDITLTSRVEWVPRHGKGDPYYKYNPVFENMTKELRDYYDNMIQIKRDMESHFPTYRIKTYRAIFVSNDLQQIIGENAGNPSKLAKLLADRAKDTVKRRMDDENYIGYEEDDEDDNVYDITSAELHVDKPADVIDQDENQDESLPKLKKKKLKVIGVRTSLSGELDETVPIPYVRHLDNNERISNDFTASMMAYVAGALNYATMTESFNRIKLLKDFIMDRDVIITQGTKKLAGYTKSVMGQSFDLTPVVKPGRETNIGKAVQSFFDSEVLGRRKNVEKISAGERDIDIGYIGDKVMHLRTMTGMALNEFAGINNDLIGRIQMLLESIGRGFYNTGDLIKAELRFHKDLIPYLAQLNETNYNDMMHLLIDKFNVLDDFFEDLKRKGYYQSNVGKILGNINLMIFNNMGEFHMHVTSFYALMYNIKVKVNGEEVPFIDAFEAVPHEVKDIQGNVIATSWTAEIKTDKTTGKSIVTDLNGNTITKDGFVPDILKLIDQGDTNAHVSDERIAKSIYKTNYINWARAATRRINQRLFGAYALIDRGAGNKTILFRAVMQFRQWMPAHIERRWGVAREDIELGMTQEGFYRTFLKWAPFSRWIYGLIEGLKGSEKEIQLRWSTMTLQEKGNVMQALSELAMFALLCLSTWLIKRQKNRDDDDDEVEFGGGDFGRAGASGSWGDDVTFLRPYGDKDTKELTPFERRHTRFRKQVYLQALRTRSDIGLAIPWITMPKHFLNIVDDPMAVTDLIESIIDLFTLSFLFQEVQSGPRKGENKYWYTVKKNVPMLGNIQRSIDFVYNANAFLQYE